MSSDSIVGHSEKWANCQVIVSLTAATEYSHLPIDMEPYLPMEWKDSQSLRERAHIPTEVTFQTKPDIALSLIARSLQSGVPKAVVLADGAYSTVGDFRDGVRALGLDYAVGIQLDTKVQLIRNEERMCSQSIPFLGLEGGIVGMPVAEHRV